MDVRRERAHRGVSAWEVIRCQRLRSLCRGNDSTSSTPPHWWSPCYAVVASVWTRTSSRWWRTSPIIGRLYLLQQQDLILRGERERERDVLKGERRRRRGVDVEREGREERERGSCDAHYIWFRFTRKTEQRRLMGPRCSYAQFEEFPFSARVSSRDIAITARQREREGGRELKRGETRRVRSVLSIKPS